MYNIIYIIIVFLINLEYYVHGNLTHIVDLTWDFDNNTAYWVGTRPFVFTKKVGNSEERGYWYAMNEFCAGEHGGTHFDAPYHFYKNGWKVGDIPADRLVVKGAVIDLQNDTLDLGANTTLDVKHLEDWERVNGPFEERSVLLVRFGYSQYWYNRTQYLGIDEDGKLNFPGISKPAAQWIANSGKFYGVGVDTPSVDPGSSVDFVAHRVLADSQLYNLENVKLVEDLPARGFTLLVMTMKIGEGTGSPLRILAVPNFIS